MHAIRTPSDAEEIFFLPGFAGITSSGLILMARFEFKRSISSGAAQQLRIEAAREWTLFCGWRLQGTYSYLYKNVSKSTHSGDLETAPRIVGASTQHEATIQSFLEISEGLQLDLTYRYVSQLPAESIPAYSTGRSALHRDLRPDSNFSMVGQSLFQLHHPEYLAILICA